MPPDIRYWTQSSPLSSFTVLAVRPAGRIGSPDPEAFLQGQVSCDLSECTPSRAARGAFCDKKGRVAADAVLVPPAQIEPGAVWQLLVRSELVGHLLQLLAPYSALSRIAIEPDEAHFCAARCGEAPPASAPSVPAAPVPAPSALPCQRFSTPQTAGCAVSLGSAAHPWQLAVLQRNAGHSTAMRPADEQLDNAVRRRAMQSGSPLLSAAVSGELTPHELGYADAGLVSFSKGCYLGQEVVARMHHLGRMKKHLRLLRLPAAGLQLESGQKIHTDSGSFRLIDAVQSDGQWLAAACVPDKAVADGRLSLTHPAGGAQIKAAAVQPNGD